jgi:4-hydroxybenzoate polyprenyltransferase
MLQVITLLMLLLAGVQFELGYWYYISLIATAGLFAYQQRLIRHRDRDQCFKAFLNNNWVGGVIFTGIVIHYAVTG